MLCRASFFFTTMRLESCLFFLRFNLQFLESFEWKSLEWSEFKFRAIWNKNSIEVYRLILDWYQWLISIIDILIWNVNPSKRSSWSSCSAIKRCVCVCTCIMRLEAHSRSLIFTTPQERICSNGSIGFSCMRANARCMTRGHPLATTVSFLWI